MALERRAARLSALAFVGLILVSLLGVRLWFLQTVESTALREDFTASTTRTVYIPPERGRIFDADGRILADNARILVLGIDPQTIKSKDRRLELFERLSGWVDVPVEEMEADWEAQTFNQYLPFPIKRGIDEETAIAIQERSEDFPGVEITSETRRVYPYAPIASHLIGYMGAINEAQFDDMLAAGYQPNERVGQFGVERALEPLLHGTWGQRTVEVDAAGRRIRTISEIKPVRGFDVQLTVDLDLQQFVEQSLQSTLRARRTQYATNPRVKNQYTQRYKYLDPDSPRTVNYPAPAGSAVVMNYLTGEVIAMASYPDFDNRWFESGVSGAKIQEVFPATDELGNPIDPDKSILVNRAAQGRYNIGSTAKPFTSFAALNSGLIGPLSYYTDRGRYRLQAVDRDKCNAGVKCVYRNSTCPWPPGEPCVYGTINVTEALAVSSDTFYYRLGEESMIGDYAGETILQDNARAFGFGAKTGIELPFEYAGAVPDKALKREYAERKVIPASEGRDYFVGDNVQFAIGQGLFAVTPLQLANAYGAIANGGFVLEPTLVKHVFVPGTPDAAETGFADISKAEIYDHPDYPAPPTVRNQVPMATEDRNAVVRGLRRAVTGPGVRDHSTTGEEVFFDTRRWPIQIAGKTGTAQGFGNYPWFDTSVFTGFAVKGGGTEPDENNPYVVSSLLEKAGYGSVASAPLVKCVFSVLSGVTETDPVVPSEPLDISSSEAAPQRYMPGDVPGASQPGCWSRSRSPSAVYYSVKSVE